MNDDGWASVTHFGGGNYSGSTGEGEARRRGEAESEGAGIADPQGVASSSSSASGSSTRRISEQTIGTIVETRSRIGSPSGSR